jgi:hypothetical protein
MTGGPSEYDRFLAVRADYLARERAASEQGERILIAGAAGALALSVTFIEKIAAKPLPSGLGMLALGWLLLLLSLCASLLTFVVRAHGFRRAREALDAGLAEGTFDVAAVRVQNRWLVGLLYFRFLSLISGVSLLVWFAFVNLPR